MDGTGKYEEAQKEYEDAVALNSSDDRAVAGLARVYEHLNRADDAEKTFKRAVLLHPNSPEGYGLLGWFYYDRAQYDQAANAFQRVIELAPEGLSGYSNLGSVYIAQGRYQEALPVLERAQSILPSAIVLSNLGTAYFCLRRYQDAARVFSQAVQLRPQDYDLWGNLGDAYYWAPGQRSQAAGAYRRAIELGEKSLKVNPRDSEVLAYVAQYRAMLGDENEANRNIWQALHLAPHSPYVWLSAAIIYSQFGRQPQTLEALRQCVANGITPIQLRDTPNFDTLRGDPQFRQLLSGG